MALSYVLLVIGVWCDLSLPSVQQSYKAGTVAVSRLEQSTVLFCVFFFMFVCLFGLSLWNGLRADLTVPILTSNKTTTQTVGGLISGFELPIARPIMIPLPKEIWSGYIAVGLF